MFVALVYPFWPRHCLPQSPKLAINLSILEAQKLRMEQRQQVKEREREGEAARERV